MILEPDLVGIVALESVGSKTSAKLLDIAIMPLLGDVIRLSLNLSGTARIFK
jgi:hypothetical protein